MAMNQFSMVEELALLIKDNLASKHLVLSTEEALINTLQDDSSEVGVLELKPMSSYDRLLLHRLADIYGFAHESVGEGEDRHLVLERCHYSSIPSILVSDILWQYDDYQHLMPSQVILKKIAGEDLKSVSTNLPTTTLKEREASYLAARERIFSGDDDDQKEETIIPKPPKVPVVARRMIAHALSQRTSNSSGDQLSAKMFKGNAVAKGSKNEIESVEQTDLASDSSKGINVPSESHLCQERNSQTSDKNSNSSSSCVDAHKKVDDKLANTGSSNCNERISGRTYMERERLGAAKRIFGRALGSQLKSNQRQGPR